MPDAEFHVEVDTGASRALPRIEHRVLVLGMERRCPSVPETLRKVHAVDRLPPGVGVGAGTVLVRGEHPERRGVAEHPEPGLALGERCRSSRHPGPELALRAQRTTPFKHLHRGQGQAAKDLALGVVQRARSPVDDAQRSGVGPVAELQGGARVEPDVGFARDQRVRGESRIHGRIRHLEDSFLQDRVRTEGLLAGRLGHAGQPHVGLEPLTIGVDQADQRDRDPAAQGRDLHQGIELALGFGVEDIELAQRLEPRRFVARQGGGGHGGSCGSPSLVEARVVRSGEQRQNRRPESRLGRRHGRMTPMPRRARGASAAALLRR